MGGGTTATVAAAATAAVTTGSLPAASIAAALVLAASNPPLSTSQDSMRSVPVTVVSVGLENVTVTVAIPPGARTPSRGETRKREALLRGGDNGDNIPIVDTVEVSTAEKMVAADGARAREGAGMLAVEGARARACAEDA